MRKWILAGLTLFLAGCVGLSGTQPAPGSSGAGETPPTETTPEPLPTEITSEPLPTASPLPEPVEADLPVLGEAPELENELWLNTDEPLRLADLRGKVVLLDMWTFG